MLRRHLARTATSDANELLSQPWTSPSQEKLADVPSITTINVNAHK